MKPPDGGSLRSPGAPHQMTGGSSAPPSRTDAYGPRLRLDTRSWRLHFGGDIAGRGKPVRTGWGLAPGGRVASAKSRFSRRAHDTHTHLAVPSTRPTVTVRAQLWRPKVPLVRPPVSTTISKPFRRYRARPHHNPGPQRTAGRPAEASASDPTAAGTRPLRALRERLLLPTVLGLKARMFPGVCSPKRAYPKEPIKM